MGEENEEKSGVIVEFVRQDDLVSFQLSDLSNSIFSSLGLAGRPDVLGIGSSPAGRECLLLIDGMGLAALNEYSHLFPIFKEFTGSDSLTSHFPSTTATNLSSLGTGELAGVHGMLGYTVRVPRSGEPGRLLNALKWDERVDPLMWQKSATNFERAAASGISATHIAAKRYEGSGFTRAALRGCSYAGANQLSEIISSTRAALRTAPSFAYVYLNNLDHAGHEAGVGSPSWLTAMQVVADLMKGLLENLPQGTRMWVTADHGMINVNESIVIGENNPLMDNVTLVGGEPRARHIYLREGTQAATQKIWEDYLGDRAQVFRKSELVESGLLGPVVTEDSRDRLGDLTVVPADQLILIDPSRVKQESSMVGHHGGLTPTELEIPLLIAQR